ncbi:ubinuclein-1-like isoform X3 [Portunus trituberculatus]|uniref:ubinuclein-1-like isoform X3 n=1 Tax=Portunus trituberculatus TaxID=210409 RepID=UPI001E1D20B0|nr:ubinuclein-1-like isoform X3 [Portunus trituberculatus]
MTEPKKVAFSTLGSMKKEKKREKKVKSLRIALTLAESNEKSCPEFNYRELLAQRLHERLGKKNLGDVINGPSLDPSDPFCTDEDAALKALAKKFETKYGTATPNRKKKRRKENDFSTLGEGYDETDPFIDNSDAFDEVVPTHLETKHRGFYINSGELDFETVPDISSEEETASSESDVRKRRPNQISSDDEGENEEGVDEKDKEEEGEEDDEEGQMKKRKLCENGFIRHKKRKLDEGELLRRRKKMIGQFNAKNLEKKDSDQETEKPLNGNESKGEVAPSEENIKASIEAVVNKARQEAVELKEESDESQSSSSNSSSSDSDSSGSSSSSGSDSDEEGGQQEEEPQRDQENEEVNEEEEEEGGEEADAPSVSSDAQPASDTEDNIPLPDNLPIDLTQVISRLKEEGHTCKGSSQKFFTDSVNKLLLSIEMKLNKLGGRKKTQIYNHLSQHLPCGTQTLVKRAKNLLTERQETRLQEPLKKLREAVEAAMPPLMEKHALECQKAAESNPQQYWELYYHFWGENGVAQNEDEENNEGDKKKSRLPKKRFLFTDEIRKLLNDVVQVRVIFWQMIRKRSETPEEYIRLFLDTEVRPIWPKGWITPRILYKESHEAHSVITDKSSIRSVPTKKTVSLGGGTVTTNTPQPPKPSLSATVIPKVSPTTPTASTTTTKPKGEPVKRKSISGETVATPGKQQPEEKVAASSGVLSIRSVEKINEGAPRKPDEEGEQASEKQERLGGEETTGRDKPQSDKKASTAATSAVSVIDLSSDEEKTLINKASLLSRTEPIPVVSGAKANKDSDEVFLMPSQGAGASNATKEDAPLLESKKEDNLEEEMNLVMNEILQISKQKSADDSMDKITKDSSKDIPSSSSSSQSVSSNSGSIKQHHHHHHHHSSSHAQETYHHHHHHHHQHTHHSKPDPHSSTTSSKQEHSSVSPGKQSSLSSSSKHHHSHHLTQESHSSSTSSKQEQSSVSPGKQSSSASPVKQSTKVPLISPVKDQSLSSPVVQHSTQQQQQQQQHGQSEVTHIHSHERHSSKSSLPDHSKHTLTSQEKHSSEHNSLLSSHKQSSQRQTYGDPHHKPSSKLHSSKQERQTHSSHSLSHSEPKSPVQSQLQHPLSSLPHHSPSQHTTKQSQQHSLQQSQHSQRQQQQQQPLNLQQPKQQQHALNLQQPKVQHPPPSYHHNSSTSQYSLSQPHSTSPEPSRQKKQQSHYSQAQHQSQSNSKPSNTSWGSSSDVTMISKTSPTSTSKTHSTWASSHDASPSRQRQSDAPIVSSSDPLANLRMMHGLSVSSVTKKTSSSTSVYHSPAALATSSIGPYNTTGSGSKKSSSSSASTTSAKASTSIPSLGSSSLGLHSSSKSSVHNYSSSQSKHSAPSLSYSSSSQHSSAAKARLDPYVTSMSQSLYGGMTPEQQLNAYKQLQQHQQTNHLTPNQQQELWQQVIMSSSGFLPGMSGMSSTDMLKLMTQMGKSMDSYTSASQHGPGQRHSQF